MNGPSQYELQILKNIQENKKVLASLGLDKFKVSLTMVMPNVRSSGASRAQSTAAECT